MGDTSSSSSDSSRTTAIAAGVAVPVGTIALAVAAYFFYRARTAKGTTKHPEGGDDADTEEKTGGNLAVPMTQGRSGEPHHEVSSDQVLRREMPASLDQVSPHEMATDSIYGGVVLEKDGRPVLAEMDTSRAVSNRL